LTAWCATALSSRQPALINATAASLHAASGAGKILVPADPQPDRADLQWVPVRPGHADRAGLERFAAAVGETAGKTDGRGAPSAAIEEAGSDSRAALLE
jgi:hypothetical protein